MTKFDTAEDFQAHCQAQEAAIRRYVNMNKRTYQQLDADTLGQLELRQSDYFHANNFRSRLRFTRNLLGKIGQYVEDNDLHSVRFVTLTPDMFATSEGDATEFDVKVLKTWVAENLPDFDYIGIVEAAYYPAWPTGRITISWHVHLLAFNMNYRRFLRHRATINAAHQSLIPGVDAAVSKPLPIPKLDYKVRYMLKFPTYRYRPSPITTKVRSASGETVRVPTGGFGQNKDDLRPGELIRMCRILARLRLDEMLFAGGAGQAVIAPVLREATAAIRRDEDRRSR